MYSVKDMYKLFLGARIRRERLQHAALATESQRIAAFRMTAAVEDLPWGRAQKGDPEAVSRLVDHYSYLLVELLETRPPAIFLTRLDALVVGRKAIRGAIRDVLKRGRSNPSDDVSSYVGLCIERRFAHFLRKIRDDIIEGLRIDLSEWSSNPGVDPERAFAVDREDGCAYEVSGDESRTHERMISDRARECLAMEDEWRRFTASNDGPSSH